MGRIDHFTSRTDAELARSALADAGIPAYVSGDDAGGLHPELPFGVGGTAVVVPDEHDEEARRLLDAQFGSGDLDDAELTAAALAAGGEDAGSDHAGAGSATDATVPPAGPTDEASHTPPSRLNLRAVAVVVVLLILVVPYVLDRLTA